MGPIFKSHIKHVLSGFALIRYNGRILPAECGEKSAFDSFEQCDVLAECTPDLGSQAQWPVIIVSHGTVFGDGWMQSTKLLYEIYSAREPALFLFTDGYTKVQMDR